MGKKIERVFCTSFHPSTKTIPNNSTDLWPLQTITRENIKISKHKQSIYCHWRTKNLHYPIYHRSFFLMGFKHIIQTVMDTYLPRTVIKIKNLDTKIITGLNIFFKYHVKYMLKSDMYIRLDANYQIDWNFAPVSGFIFLYLKSKKYVETPPPKIRILSPA